MEGQFLIVGGNSGIGRELARNLAFRGAAVYRASRTEGDLDEVPGVRFQRFDATDATARLELPESLDGLVYCPGTIRLKPFGRLSDEDFREEWEVNYLGAVRTIRQAEPALRKVDNASIVLFSTVAVQTGLPYHASISGAKGALEGLTRSLAAEFSPGIRVNALALSLTDTPLASALLNSDEKRRASAERHPLKRVGDPKEVARAAEFLLGSDSGFMTGQILKMDGGISTLKLL